MEVQKLYNFIDGSFKPPVSENYLDIFEPATGNSYALLPDSDERDVETAFHAAHLAFENWSNTPAQQRSAILVNLAKLIESNLDKLAEAESMDNGKPLHLAKTLDIPRASTNIHFFGTSILHFSSESHYMEDGAINYTLRRPIGVVGCISPWNLPLYLFTWKIAPALAAGNCVVAKPSEITPMTAYLFSALCNEAGLPKGVLNIVHGLGNKVGNAIVAHPGISAISFTGGTKTGEHIAKVAALLFKKLSLELGGKNATIIFADCSYENMLTTVIRSAFSNQGQICLCGSRIYIERPLYDKFKQDFVLKASELIVGDPNDLRTDLGAVVSFQHLQKILSYVELAKEEGGIILTGGNQKQPEGRCKNGWFMEPTIIEGLSNHCRTNQEEIFGPVVTISPFDTEDEVINLANGTPYGLAASIWTEKIGKANRVAEKIKTGVVWINCWMIRDLRTPFGGVKQSGVGREGGWEALRFFTEAKNVCIKYSNGK